MDVQVLVHPVAQALVFKVVPAHVKTHVVMLVHVYATVASIVAAEHVREAAQQVTECKTETEYLGAYEIY